MPKSNKYRVEWSYDREAAMDSLKYDRNPWAVLFRVDAQSPYSSTWREEIRDAARKAGCVLSRYMIETTAADMAKRCQYGRAVCWIVAN